MAQCQGTTQKGDQCKREAQEGGAYCSIHQGQAERPPRAREAVEWDSEAVLAATLGFALVAAIVFIRIK